MAAAHQVQVGRRQYRHRDAGAGQLCGDRGEAIGREQRHLRGVSDRNPAAPTIFLRLAADIFDLHPLRGLGKIEMHIDFSIEVACDRKDPVDLAARVGVEIGNGADRPRAPAQALDQQFLGAGIVGEPFLREDAHFYIHRPGMVAR